MTSNPDCKTCAHETINGPIDLTQTNAEIARQIHVSKDSVRRHRKHTASVAKQAIAYDQEYVNDTYDPATR